MLLQRLAEQSERISGLAPQGYRLAPIRYLIQLDEYGRLETPYMIDWKDKENPTGRRMMIPLVQRSGNSIRPCILADKGDYTLGIAKDVSKQERAHLCHQAYLQLLTKCADETELPSVQAVLSFLQDEPLSHLIIPEDYDAGSIILFQVKGAFPVENPAIRRFWAKYNASDDTADETADRMQCLICGDVKHVVRVVKDKIKGIPGGQPAGTAIISANAEAFESYGLEQSYIAPVCEECSDKFTKAINEMLRDKGSSLRLGQVAFIFWSPEQTGIDWRTLFDEPDPELVRDLLNSVRTGKTASKVDESAFYAISFSASGGRAVVRDWIDTTVGHANAALARWFQGQRIVGLHGEEPRPSGVFGLAAATVRDSKDIDAKTPAILLRSCLTEMPLPLYLLQQAIQRNKAERDVSRLRATLIKLILFSQNNIEEDEMTQLSRDPSQPPAYHCGRLLAVLERIQRTALPGINSTLVDKFYASASTAPATVFGKLISDAQPHLSKLRRSNQTGATTALQRELEEVLSALDAFPRTLHLKDQGFFALGYYHQRAENSARAQAAAAKKALKQDQPNDNPLHATLLEDE